MPRSSILRGWDGNENTAGARGKCCARAKKCWEKHWRSGAKLKTVLVRDGWVSPLCQRGGRAGSSLYSAPDALFKLASEVETPQNVIFSCEQPQWTADALDGAGQVLLLDGLQDPGNLARSYAPRKRSRSAPLC